MHASASVVALMAQGRQTTDGALVLGLLWGGRSDRLKGGRLNCRAAQRG
jgi:hypothetical protein